MNLSPRCKTCSGEDCVCCAVWLEAQADARAMADRDPAEVEEELREMAELEGEPDEEDESEEDEDPEATEAGQRRLDNLRSDWENDTPMGQAYGDGFEPEE